MCRAVSDVCLRLVHVSAQLSAAALGAGPACRAVSDACLRFLHLSAWSLGIGVVGVAGVPGSFGLVSVFAASDLVIPHLPVGFLGHERVCRAGSELWMWFVHLSAGLSAAAL